VEARGNYVGEFVFVDRSQRIGGAAGILVAGGLCVLGAALGWHSLLSESGSFDWVWLLIVLALTSGVSSSSGSAWRRFVKASVHNRSFALTKTDWSAR
jgi:hypothetical protein